MRTELGLVIAWFAPALALGRNSNVSAFSPLLPPLSLQDLFASYPTKPPTAPRQGPYQSGGPTPTEQLVFESGDSWTNAGATTVPNIVIGQCDSIEIDVFVTTLFSDVEVVISSQTATVYTLSTGAGAAGVA